MSLVQLLDMAVAWFGGTFWRRVGPKLSTSAAEGARSCFGAVLDVSKIKQLCMRTSRLFPCTPAGCGMFLGHVQGHVPYIDDVHFTMCSASSQLLLRGAQQFWVQASTLHPSRDGGTVPTATSRGSPCGAAAASACLGVCESLGRNRVGGGVTA